MDPANCKLYQTHESSDFHGFGIAREVANLVVCLWQRAAERNVKINSGSAVMINKVKTFAGPVLEDEICTGQRCVGVDVDGEIRDAVGIPIALNDLHPIGQG